MNRPIATASLILSFWIFNLFGGHSNVAAQENPFAPSTNSTAVPGATESESETVINQLRRSISDLDRKNDAFEQAVVNSRNQLNVAMSQITRDHQSQMRLLKKMLRSDFEPTREMALAQLVSISDFRVASMRFQLDDEAMRILNQLADSKNADVRSSARKILIGLASDPIQLGLQIKSQRWLPESTPSMNNVRAMLVKDSQLEYEGTPLTEVLEEFSQRYRIGFLPAGDVEIEKVLVTASFHGPLIVGLDAILRPSGLTFRVNEKHIEIVNIADKRAITSVTFNVRGLLTAALPLDELARQLNERFKKEESKLMVNVIDDRRMSITGTEIQVDEVSKFLATLNPE